MKHLKLYIIFICVLTACTSLNDKRLEYALDFAGENRYELEKVLEYYKNEPQKLAAACFLIENMPRFYSYKGWQLDTIKAILSKEIKKNTTYGLSSIIIDDELIKEWGNISFSNYEIIYDAHTITADYLIENIELSFKVWEEQPWNKHLSFDDFCELILPYRVGNEPLENWRKVYYTYYSSLLDSLYSGSDIMKACDTLARYINDEGFYLCTDFNLPNEGALYLKDNRIGYCRDACDFILYAMRSVGIPVATDFYHYSPDNRLGHSWNVVRDTTGNYLQCGYTVFGTETNVRNDGRKKGKVYRFCIRSQKERFKGISYDNTIPYLFRDRYIKDVTSDYFGKNQVVIPVGRQDNKYAYLGVFNLDKWIPIDIGTIKNGNAVFQNIEPHVIYQPLSGKDGNMYPAAYPFVYTGKDIKYFIPDTENTEEAILKRKFPIRFYTVVSLNRNVRGAKIVGSSNIAFNNPEIIYEIQDTIISNRNIITFSEPRKYRYLRYVSPEGKPLELAELCVYEDEDKLVPLQLMDSITPIHTNSKFAVKHIVDNDPLTFTLSKNPSCYLTFDMGKITEIHKIMFIPRNDENFIHPGDTYELFYNDGLKGWLSLGKQVAKKNELIYQTPKGALLWLRNLTKGKEEHIFYMENGKQIFAGEIK